MSQAKPPSRALQNLPHQCNLRCIRNAKALDVNHIFWPKEQSLLTLPRPFAPLFRALDFSLPFTSIALVAIWQLGSSSDSPFAKRSWTRMSAAPINNLWEGPIDMKLLCAKVFAFRLVHTHSWAALAGSSEKGEL